MSKKDPKDQKVLDEIPGFKRTNPTYFENEVIDHLIGISLDLGAELWVVKDRLAHLEEILSQIHDLNLSQLETSKPSEELEKILEEERKKIIKRIYGRLYSKYGGESAEEKGAI